MNDPNGLVFHRGVYHLFFQYHPHSSVELGAATQQSFYLVVPHKSRVDAHLKIMA